MTAIGSVTADQLKTMISDGEELALIDVREQGVFGQGHLLFAICLPLSRLELRIHDLIPRRGVRTVLVDAGDGSDLAAAAAEKLVDLGYTDGKSVV